MIFATNLPQALLACPIGGEWTQVPGEPFEIQKGANFREFVRHKHGHWNRVVFKSEQFS